ncbi:DUF4184 family protein [Pontibacter oryzae]|uniref:DUF4184 family protein n=1 Tax=Pontibacter oryzae TaxID=2304593 RepID=A0A399S3F4_9BACT|nr:DUF4184 family protein [Pontibacter oryzae]RIJ36989.1 DUF4184 family protein [Pontibacter oryzae]
MPFTAAHPAIILPLLRRHGRWLSVTGLVLGSMAPDFEYFFRLRTKSLLSHSLPGLFVFDLPLVLLLSILFHGVVREQVVRNLPWYFKRRALAVPVIPNWRAYLRQNWLAVSISALIGAASHIFWDSFTHDSGYFVKSLPILATYVRIPVVNFYMEVCRMVQHLSTLVGFALILWHVHYLPAVSQLAVKRSHWIGFWLWIFVGGCFFLMLNLLLRQHLSQMGSSIGVTLISGWMLALLLTIAADKMRHLVYNKL